MNRVHRLAGPVVLATAALAAGCQPAAVGKARPAEIPIDEFHADAPASGPPEPEAAKSTATPPPLSPMAGKADDGGNLGGAPDGPRDAVATKLDDKNGFGGATFGSAPRAFRGLKQAVKRGDRVTYHLTTGTSYASAPLNKVDYTFTKNKLGVIAFTVRNSADCKPVRAALERELGAPQKVVASPETAVWKGGKVALRYNGGVTCGGTVVSRDHGGPDFAGIDN